jgi:hypothetical protein
MNAFRALKTVAATGMAVLAGSAALAGPEIKVQMLQVGLATDVAEAGSVTFPEIELGQSQAIFFSIENIGDEDLEFTSDPAVSIVDQGGGFSVLTSPNPFAIPPGFSQTFRIRHTPTSDVLKQARMFIFTNATNTVGPFDATLFGKALTVEEDPGDDIEPNEPVDNNEPNEPADDVEPNQPVDDGGDLDPNDNENVDEPNDLEDPNDQVQDPNEYAGDPNEYAGDPNEDLDANDLEQDPNDEFIAIDDFAPVVPGCGFGIGFASMMCMVSLCGARRHGR